MVCVVGADPTCSAGKLREAGDNKIGWVQPLAFPTAKQTSPVSPGIFPAGQAPVLTPYPLVPCKTVPTAEVTIATGAGEGFDRPAGAPIRPTFNPLLAISCRITEFPLIWPFTERSEEH